MCNCLVAFLLLSKKNCQTRINIQFHCEWLRLNLRQDKISNVICFLTVASTAINYFGILCLKSFNTDQSSLKPKIQLRKKSIHKHQFRTFRNGTRLTNHLFVVSYKSAPVREEFQSFWNCPDIIPRIFRLLVHGRSSGIESDGRERF